MLDLELKQAPNFQSSEPRGTAQKGERQALRQQGSGILASPKSLVREQTVGGDTLLLLNCKSADLEKVWPKLEPLCHVSLTYSNPKGGAHVTQDSVAIRTPTRSCQSEEEVALPGTMPSSSSL